MDKQITVYLYSGLTLSNREEQTAAIYNDMDESQKHYAKQKTQKNYILEMFYCMTVVVFTPLYTFVKIQIVF